MPDAVGAPAPALPIVVRCAPRPDDYEQNGDEYLIMWGEPHYRAAKDAGLNRVPIIIRDKLFEEIHHPNQTILEQAQKIRYLMERDKLSYQGAADYLHEKKPWVQMRMDVLRAGADIHRLVEKRPHSLLAAQRLSYVTDDDVRRELIDDYKRGVPYTTIAKRIAQWRAATKASTGGPNLQVTGRLNQLVESLNAVYEAVQSEPLPDDYRHELHKLAQQLVTVIDEPGAGQDSKVARRTDS